MPSMTPKTVTGQQTPDNHGRKAFQRLFSGKNFMKCRITWFIILAYLVLALFWPEHVLPSLAYVGQSFWELLPFLILSVGLAAFIQASGADALIAQVFARSPVQSLILAAFFGALSPFCSCGVIPLIASLLAAGVPLAPVMAFMIASPLMDPEMFLISTGVLGLEFTMARTIAAIFAGLLSGFLVHLLSTTWDFSNPLRTNNQSTSSNSTSSSSCCGSSSKPSQEQEKPVWKIWRSPERMRDFYTQSLQTGLYLGKWMLLAFVVTSFMVAFVPSTWVANYLGGGSWWTVPAAVLAGFPAYVNGYAATPLIAELVHMGMAPGAAMGFLVAGSVACLPSAIAFFGVARGRIFALYLVLGTLISLIAGFAFQAYSLL